MVKDPVCGMMVDETGSAQTTYNGQTYYFCSQECKNKFDKDPDRYTKQQQSQSSMRR